MHEELVEDGEIREATSHPHIFRIRTGQRDACGVKRETLDELIALAEAQRNGELVERLRELVLSPFVGASFLALDRGYITRQEQQTLYDEGERLGKSINAFRNTLR